MSNLSKASGGDGIFVRPKDVKRHFLQEPRLFEERQNGTNANSSQLMLNVGYSNRKVSTKNLARQIGAKSVEPCAPEVANRHSGYLVGGTSPFGTRRSMPVFIEESILALPKILINGGRRGYLVGIDPAVCVQLLSAKQVQCALSD